MDFGKRPRSNESPLIVLKDRKPFLALARPAMMRHLARLVQVIVNLIDFRMDIQSAITALRDSTAEHRRRGPRSARCSSSKTAFRNR